MSNRKNNAFPGELVQRSGILEIMENGKFGQLIDPKLNGYADPADPYVDHGLLKKFELKRGQLIDAHIMPRQNFPNPKVVSVDRIDGLPIERVLSRPKFLSLESVMPREQLRLENSGCTMSSRVLDLFCPIAKGQRCLIVAPPRTGKTLLLHEIARGISANYPDIKIIVVLIDERPEEVTDFKRSVAVELFASSNDQPTRNHIRVAELACERAKNLVELGFDTVLLLDSITRLARAYNSFSNSGRTMSGGVDSRALEKPRQLFSLARDLESQGSLTILASALVGTGSDMDDLIFQEFKGTGNAEIVLNKKLAEQRIWPAINLKESGVRREEGILAAEVLRKVEFLRRACSNMRSEEATESILQRIGQTRTNAEFLNLLNGI
ncbi:MAG: transcription termination factor Rho [Puniceicoccales bacterium]|jgi:transcription termination factor Rho|nr:transcription termination factor Rho [Puniceicoccales bacterium]